MVLVCEWRMIYNAWRNDGKILKYHGKLWSIYCDNLCSFRIISKNHRWNDKKRKKERYGMVWW